MKTNFHENIVIFGMTGCGKSFIGRKVSKKLKREFFDIDSMIEEKFSMTTDEIFSNFGEQKFREVESQILYSLISKTDSVIAVNGGCVLNKFNLDILRKNGVLILLDRGENTLSLEGKSDLDKSRVAIIYNNRKGVYNQFVDYMVTNNNSPKWAVKDIIKCYIER